MLISPYYFLTNCLEYIRSYQLQESNKPSTTVYKHAVTELNSIPNRLIIVLMSLSIGVFLVICTSSFSLSNPKHNNADYYINSAPSGMYSDTLLNKLQTSSLEVKVTSSSQSISSTNILDDRKVYDSNYLYFEYPKNWVVKVTSAKKDGSINRFEDISEIIMKNSSDTKILQLSKFLEPLLSNQDTPAFFKYSINTHLLQSYHPYFKNPPKDLIIESIQTNLTNSRVDEIGQGLYLAKFNNYDGTKCGEDVRDYDSLKFRTNETILTEINNLYKLDYGEAKKLLKPEYFGDITIKNLWNSNDNMTILHNASFNTIDETVDQRYIVPMFCSNGIDCNWSPIYKQQEVVSDGLRLSLSFNTTLDLCSDRVNIGYVSDQEYEKDLTILRMIFNSIRKK